jgi:hypothetical protein
MAIFNHIRSHYGSDMPGYAMSDQAWLDYFKESYCTNNNLTNAIKWHTFLHRDSATHRLRNHTHIGFKP